MPNKVKVLDSEKQVLFETDMENIDKAWTYAADMEEMGIEVTIDAPSLPETLAGSLGMNSADRAKLREEINFEIEEHDTGCCFEKPETEPQE